MSAPFNERQLNTGAAERVTLDTSWGPIAALRSGDGPPALLIPGYTGSKEDFGPLLDPIAAAGLCAVAVDLPGQFESPGPTDPAAYLPTSLAGVVGELSAQLGGRVALLGHSFGGLVARAAVLADPGRYASLVLMSSGPAAIAGTRAALIARLEPMLAASGLAAVYAAGEALARSAPGYVAPPAELAAFLERRFVAGTPAMLSGIGTALRTEPDRVDELAAVDVPVLVLYGVDDDAWPPSEQADMARRLGAAVCVVRDAAHSPAIENPSTTADELISFWRAPS